MPGFPARFARSHPRVRRPHPPDVGVRFTAEELVRYAGPTQMVLSSHYPPPRRAGASTRPAHGSAGPWVLARRRPRRVPAAQVAKR